MIIRRLAAAVSHSRNAWREPSNRLARKTLQSAAVLMICAALPSQAQTLAEGFSSTVVFSGLTEPTAVRFAPDGRVFIAEKGGTIKVFDGLGDPAADMLDDILSEHVHNFSDRGLLGLAIDPDFPTRPYLYVLYSHDQRPDGGSWGDTCPDPPGSNDDGCVINARLSRLEVSIKNELAGGEEILLSGNWCQQYPSHSIGDLVFGEDGMLYASAGDGASFIFADYGQGGGSPGSPVPTNPCDDPPGGEIAPPTAEGGALRSQDLLTSGDPIGFDGTLLRIDVSELPAQAPADNPLLDNADPGDDLIVAHGLRNPYRITHRPGTPEIWIGDVGWNLWEEINVVADPTDATIENFGWPCYEGSYSDGSGSRNRVAPPYNNLNVDLCEDLYDQGIRPLGGTASSETTPPFYAYSHLERVVPGEVCGFFSSSPAGIAFYGGDRYPNRFQGAAFFQDSSRQCAWAILPGADGAPDPSRRFSFFRSPTGFPVDLQAGPEGDLFYVTIDDGSVHRIRFDRDTQLAVSGDCPGTATLEVSDATPGGPIGIAIASNPGTFVVPSGECAGTTIGLDSPTLLTTIDADGDGNAAFSGPIPPAACGASVQAIDLRTCKTTPPVQIAP